MRKAFSFIFLLLVLLLTTFSPVSSYASTSLESYCKDGYYQIPGEKKCSRAPKCGGYGYDDLNKAEFMPNNNDCLDEGKGMVIGNPPNTSAFYGYPPLCCYEMERLKDPEMCIGYWERLWCHPDQCKAINNDTGCGGGGCQCAHAMKGWCETRHCNLLSPVPIEVRLGQKPSQPTSIPTVRPTPIATILPPTLQPTQYIPPSNPPINTSFTPPLTSVPVIYPTTYIPSNLTPSLPPSINIEPLKRNIKIAIVQSEKVLSVPAEVVNKITQLDASLEAIIAQLIKNIINKVYLRTFSSFFVYATIAGCSCNGEHCYPDGCTRKTIKTDGTIDYGLCGSIGCSGAYGSCYPAGDVEHTEIGPYYCVQQPPCCKDMVERNDPEACCWPERGFCHPYFCSKVSRPERCGWYWIFHDGYSNREQGYGCMKGASTETLQPIFGLPAGVPGAQPTAPPPTQRPPTSTPIVIPPTAPVPTAVIIPPTTIPTLPPLISSTITPFTQENAPIPTIFISPLPASANTGFIKEFMDNSAPIIKATAYKVVINSEKILNIPSSVGSTILNLDQKLELFINTFFLQLIKLILKNIFDVGY